MKRHSQVRDSCHYLRLMNASCITLHPKVLRDHTQTSILADWWHLIDHLKHYQSLMG
jgi:hypothetical protein